VASHATHIKICIDVCNSIQFEWLKTQNIAVTIQEPTQVTSCSNLLAPVRHLSSNSRSARMSFSHVQRVFIVEHYLASLSYLTCQKECRDTLPDSKKRTAQILFRSTFGVKRRYRTWWTFPTLNVTLFLSDFSVIYVLTNNTSIRNISITVLTIHPVESRINVRILLQVVTDELQNDKLVVLE
jgi:hypothetical protein